MKFVDPKTDIAFKKIFSNDAHKEILQEFLNEILILESPIASLEILNPYQVPKLYDMNVTSLDIKAKDQLEREFIIEMQVAREEWFMQRALYYSAKSYGQQLRISGNYEELHPVIFLGILNFNAFEHDRYFTRHAILDVESHEWQLRDLEFNFIELPKFQKSENELKTAAEKWIYFLKQAKNLDHVPENTDFLSLQTAYQIAEQHQWSRDELELYDAQEKEAHRQRNVFETAKREGLEQGLEQGRAEGLELGKQEGIEQGKIDVAKKLLATMDDVQIAELTGLAIQTVTQLRND